MEARNEYEADLFRRYESRIVAVELLCEAFDTFKEKYMPLIDALVSDVEVDKRVKEALKRERAIVLTRVQLYIAFAALILPSLFTYLLLTLAGKP